MTNHEQRAYDALAMKLTEAGYAYENTSWKNDATASISVSCARVIISEGEDEVQQFEFQIYIPNGDCWDPDNELFDTYAVTEEHNGHTNDFFRADEVVEHIQNCMRDVVFTN